jgi:glutamyl-tRNA synthetase
MPQKIKINDLIHGQIEFDTSVIKDQVLIKSDGSPAYNFACVVDDATLNITHVIRGDDHISNTPKQILFYEALGFKVPEFAHLPLILGKGGGRLSKRTGATAVTDYRKAGYLPQAFLNYLMLLGWAPAGEREIIETQEAIKIFDIKKSNKTAATFDLDKLRWINAQYIKRMPVEKLTGLILPLVEERYQISDIRYQIDWLKGLVKLYQGRISTLNDFIDWTDFFFLDKIEVNPKAQKKFLSRPLVREFRILIGRVGQLEPFGIQGIETEFRRLVAELGLKPRDLVHPVRVALTGRTVGAGLFETMYYLGKERIKQRLEEWIKKWEDCLS